MTNQTVILAPGRHESVSDEFRLEPGKCYWLGVYVREGGNIPRDLDLYLQLQSKTPGAWATRGRDFGVHDGTRLVGQGTQYRVQRKAAPHAIGVYLQLLDWEG